MLHGESGRVTASFREWPGQPLRLWRGHFLVPPTEQAGAVRFGATATAVLR